MSFSYHIDASCLSLPLTLRCFLLLFINFFASYCIVFFPLFIFRFPCNDLSHFYCLPSSSPTALFLFTRFFSLVHTASFNLPLYWLFYALINHTAICSALTLPLLWCLYPSSIFFTLTFFYLLHVAIYLFAFERVVFGLFFTFWLITLASHLLFLSFYRVFLTFHLFLLPHVASLYIFLFRFALFCFPCFIYPSSSPFCFSSTFILHYFYYFSLTAQQTHF